MTTKNLKPSTMMMKQKSIYPKMNTKNFKSKLMKMDRTLTMYLEREKSKRQRAHKKKEVRTALKWTILQITTQLLTSEKNLENIFLVMMMNIGTTISIQALFKPSLKKRVLKNSLFGQKTKSSKCLKMTLLLCQWTIQNLILDFS